MSRPVLPKLPPSKLKSLDDLLTKEQRAELSADLAAIAKCVRPCWADQPPTAARGESDG